MRARLMLATAAVAATTTFAIPEARPCSYAPAAWNVSHRGDTIVIASGEPIMVTLEGWDNPYEDLPPFSAQAFEPTLEGPEGVIGVEVEGMDGPTPNTARLLLRPDTTLDPASAYTLTVVSTDPNWPDERTFSLAFVEALSAPVPTLTLNDATELKRPGGEACCEASAGDDSTCFTDSCGDWMHGEECRICWTTSFAYPVVLSLRWSLAEGAVSGRYTHRLLRTDAAGNTLEIVEESIYGEQGGVQWAEGDSEALCAKVEVHDVISDTTSISDVLCVDFADVTKLEREEPDTDLYEDRCKAGTTTEPVPPDNNAPNNEIGGPNPPGPDQEGDNSGSKAEPGGCSSAPIAKGGATGWAILIGLLLVGRRRD